MHHHHLLLHDYNLLAHSRSNRLRVQEHLGRLAGLLLWQALFHNRVETQSAIFTILTFCDQNNLLSLCIWPSSSERNLLHAVTNFALARVRQQGLYCKLAIQKSLCRILLWLQRSWFLAGDCIFFLSWLWLFNLDYPAYCLSPSTSSLNGSYTFKWRTEHGNHKRSQEIGQFCRDLQTWAGGTGIALLVMWVGTPGCGVCLLRAVYELGPQNDVCHFSCDSPFFSYQIGRHCPPAFLLHIWALRLRDPGHQSCQSQSLMWHEILACLFLWTPPLSCILQYQSWLKIFDLEMIQFRGMF